MGRAEGVKGGAVGGVHGVDRLLSDDIGDGVLDDEKRLFLRLGDRVLHADYEEWGLGAVVEVMTSIVPGGTCIVRILFEDGRQRTFINDMDNELCCCYRGVRKEWRLGFGEAQRASRGTPRRRLNDR
jgi:hypothetical protein